MNQPDAKELLRKYSQNLCTDEEKAWVETYYNLHQPDAGHQLTDAEITAHLLELDSLLPLHQPKPYNIWRYTAAASVILVLAAAAWFYLIRPQQHATLVKAKITHDVLPGSEKAVLTLANGKKIDLTDIKNGNIAQDAGVAITKTADGELSYEVKSASPAPETASGFNTIQTPSGGHYRVKLPDGTVIWLNAESTLKYPLVFAGNERKVQITGEAYFEVAHNAAKPFRVITDKQTIEVLGTHFNLMAYANEAAVATTLLQGSVKVVAGGETLLLKPGEQSKVAGGKILKVSDANIDDVIAWHNGKIQFTDLDIQSIMRMLARWYSIDVHYAGAPVSTTFTGSVSQTKNLSVLLKILESTGDVHFNIEGRRVTVMP